MILAILVESPKEHFCEIILKSSHWPRSRYRLKVFLFLALAAIFFGGAEFLVERHPRNISMKLFCLFIEAKQILAMLVEGHPRSISVKLF